jgi:hypothetical protein
VSRDLTKVDHEVHASVGRLLVNGQYDEAAEAIFSLEGECEHAGETVAAEMFRVVY